MKKLLIKTFLVAIVACACFTLASCSKSAEDLNKEAKALVRADGTIAADDIDDAIDLMQQLADKAKSIQSDVVDATKDRDFDNPVFEEATLVGQAALMLGAALDASNLSAEQTNKLLDVAKSL